MWNGGLFMTDLMEIIKERRSIRKYEEKKVPKEILNQILKAVRWTPSWGNTQCWEIIVIENSTLRLQLQETLSPKNPATKSIADAPTLLAICGKLASSGYYKDEVSTKLGDWFMFDLGLATQTICLVAQGLGLGTVIVGYFDHERAHEILKVPNGYKVVALIPMGYPAKEPAAPKRREISEFTHYDMF